MSSYEDTDRRALWTFNVNATTYNTRTKRKFRFRVEPGVHLKDDRLRRRLLSVIKRLRDNAVVAGLLNDIEEITCEVIADVYDSALHGRRREPPEPCCTTPFQRWLEVTGKERFKLWAFDFAVVATTEPNERIRSYQCDPLADCKPGYRVQEAVVDSFDLYYCVSNDKTKAQADKRNRLVTAVHDLMDRIVDVHERELERGNMQSKTS